MNQNKILQEAASAWDVSEETATQVNTRIHDQAKRDDEFVARADKYIKSISDTFPYIDWNIGTALEIGSGVGFIMEAVERKTRSNRIRKIIGLDISSSMIGMARQRLHDNPFLKSRVFDFANYDGVTFPFPDNHFDIIYSVASLQHIPKPYVYNLLFEIKRTLKPTGTALLHFLPFSSIGKDNFSWRDEITQQIKSIERRHWHHFYSIDELNNVLTAGTGFQHVHISQDIYACIKKGPLTLPARFLAAKYKGLHVDLSELSELDAALHFLRYGWREGRDWR